MPGARRARHALFGLIFVLSGAAGLVYELVWVRELYEVFGSTIHSVTTVVAAYMGGLGLGAWVLGRRADALARPARLYGLLELAIGLFGLASPWVVRGVGTVYLDLARALAPGLWIGTAIKFVFAFVVLLIPTFLMGGTLPVLTRAFAGDRSDELRGELALFYGLNTVGGVAGCLLAGYVLIEFVGLRASLLGTAAVNLALGVAALLLARLPVPALPPEPADGEPTFTPDPGRATRRLATGLIAFTALASLLYEIAWTRALILVIGSSTYAFTTILACFLAGIGLGSLVAVGRGRAPRDLLLRAAAVQGGIAVLASLLFPFFRTLPVYVVATLQVPFVGVGELLALHALAVALVVIPPAVGMGYSFPLLAELASERAGATGREVGRAYLANTLGSIAGAVVTGFVLVHLIGSERTLVVGVVVNVAAAAALSWWAYRERGGAGLPVGIERVPLALGLLAVVITLATPSWSERLLDRAPAVYGRTRLDREDLAHYLRGYGSEQLYFKEGWNSAVSVWRDGNQTWLKVNGKVDASSVADMDTQVSLGLLPALAQGRPRRVFVVGFGSGATTRTIADVPGVERIDVAEIERAVLRAAPDFRDVNRDVLADPRVHVIEDDARSALMLADSAYDLIVSEPSNPWIAGVASLFTRDYFRVVARRLAPDGVFCQWLQMYRVTPGAVAVVVANLRAVFPHVEIWFANASDLVVLGARAPIRWNRARVAEALRPGTRTAGALRMWLQVEEPGQLLGHFLLGDRGTAALAGGAPFRHTDDHPTLEFEAARSLLAGTSSDVVFDSLLALKAAVGDSLPALDGWPLAAGEWRAGYAAALPDDHAEAQRSAEAALRTAPRDPRYQGLLGTVLFGRRDFRAAAAHLDTALAATPGDAKLMLTAGLTSVALSDVARARRQLEGVREHGGDSAFAAAVLAQLDANSGDYAAAAVEAVRAIVSLRPTLERPFPGALEGAVTVLGQRAPPPLAGPVFERAVAALPYWQTGYWGGAVVGARAGGPACARAEHLALDLERFGWTAEEIVPLVRSCLTQRPS
ncbi:MAG TPA: fused MFS/spermidine synthase [Gemmatimonadales bacterium]|nr:fused MFS/spermidine synthase [Gemmatimonadales bacterium]